MFHQPDRVTGLYAEEPLGSGGALVEIAGRDSIGAVVALARTGALRRVLPTVAYTGTEYGDIPALFGNVERLRRLLGPLEVEVMEPVALGSPLWWRATVGRFNSILAHAYGPWHICIGCHMYLHAVRAPLAWESGTELQVAGERLEHGGKVKINQTRPAVEAYRHALEEFGIGLEMPLLEVHDERSIRDLVGDWGEGEMQPECVLSGNYRRLGDGLPYDRERLDAYLEEYLVPATSAILISLRERGEADYDSIVAGIVSRGPLGG